jgi:hypothetical protein
MAVVLKGVLDYWLGPPWTGSTITFAAATAVGLMVDRPQATSTGRRAKSTIVPSRL